MKHDEEKLDQYGLPIATHRACDWCGLRFKLRGMADVHCPTCAGILRAAARKGMRIPKRVPFDSPVHPQNEGGHHG